MAFEHVVLGELDYAPCRYGESQLVMRGPKRHPRERYVACLGSTETYGKFVPEPFPVLLEQLVHTPCVNLGVVNGGIDAFVDDVDIHAIANRAACTIIQVMSAHNISNRYYSVHPRRNDRFIAPSETLCELYPEVDFTEFHFTRAMLLRLRQVSRPRFCYIVDELKAAWMARMRQLLESLVGPVVLLWVSEEAPPAPDDIRIRCDPLFVDAEMLAELSEQQSVIVDISPAARATNTRGMIFNTLQSAMAAELLGPSGHCEVAVALFGPINQLLSDWPEDTKAPHKRGPLKISKGR